MGFSSKRVSVWVAVACTDSGRVLIARRAKGCRNGGQWNLFGGQLDSGEHPEEAAQRELLEEAGIHVSAASLAKLGEVTSQGKHNLLYGLSFDHEIKPVLNAESDCWRWIDGEDLSNHRPLHGPTGRFVPIIRDWLSDLAAPPPVTEEPRLAAPPPVAEEPRLAAPPPVAEKPRRPLWRRMVTEVRRVLSERRQA